MNDSADRAPGTLLYELESIQNLLAEEGEDLASIPILRDIVSDTAKLQTARIAEQFVPTLTIEKPATPTLSTDDHDYFYQRDLLIQEVVDEFIPSIEASLRERLHQLTDDELQALLKPS
jgi:hypothetical protein